MYRTPMCLGFKCICAAILLLTNSTWAGTLKFGDILVADPDLNYFLDGRAERSPAIWSVDPLNGDRRLVSGRGVGTGAPLLGPSTIVWDRKGQILVADPYAASILSIDPESGNRSIFSPGPVSDISRATENSIVAADQSQRIVSRVDLATGTRSLLSGSIRGSGPEFNRPYGIATGMAGEVYVIDIGSPVNELETVLFAIDPLSGDRRILYGDRYASTSIGTPLGLAVLPNGNILARTSSDGIDVIDRLTGEVTRIGSTRFGTGPMLQSNSYLVLSSPSSRVFLTDRDQGAIFEFDLSTGTRRILSGFTVGDGPAFGTPLGMALIVPEPSIAKFFLALLASNGLIARRRIGHRF